MKEIMMSACIRHGREVSNMKKLSIITLIIAAIAVSLMAFASSSYAYKGDPTVKGTKYSESRGLEKEKAFDNNDYNAWKNLMQGKGKVTQVINKDNFAQFAKAHNLAEEGKTAEANQIRIQLGLGLQNGNGQGKGMGQCVSR